MKTLPLCFFKLLFFIPSVTFASGFHIPNQSVVAMGIAGAHVAYTPGPDSAYYNPANMSYHSDSWKMEGSLTTLYLSPINYSDNRSPLLYGSSEPELFFLPQLHIASKDYHDFRFGFSITYPFGLTKRWEQPFQAATARRYKLITIEGNPSFSYSFSKKFSIGGGLRFIYNDGEVGSSLENSSLFSISPLSSLTSNIEGNDIHVGYNLAATFHPNNNLSLAATFRSKVELDLEGEASLKALAGPISLMDYSGKGNLAITLPAIFSLASSYTFNNVTFEVTWNRTYWSSFERLDFQFEQSFLGTTFDGFDRAIVKSWHDSDALRFGITYEVTSKFKTTLGFAYDENPVPESTLGFELPDSNAFMYSAGLQYKHTENLILALSYSYQDVTSRSVSNNRFDQLPGIDGVFKDIEAHAITFGVVYNF